MTLTPARSASVHAVRIDPSRAGWRTAAVTASAPLVLLTSTPAAALVRDGGDEPGKGISVGTTLLLYVGAPLALFVIIALAVAAPSIARGPRYRPGLGWWASPVWFAGPQDPEGAVATVDPEIVTDTLQRGGGASAHW